MHRLPEISDAETAYSNDFVPLRYNEGKQLVIFLAFVLALVLPWPLGVTLVAWTVVGMWAMR